MPQPASRRRGWPLASGARRAPAFRPPSPKACSHVPPRARAGRASMPGHVLRAPGEGSVVSFVSRGSSSSTSDAPLVEANAQHLAHISRWHSKSRVRRVAPAASTPSSAEPFIRHLAHCATVLAMGSCRRQVLLRDQKKCQVPGCRNTPALDVHHIQPRAEGGTHHAHNQLGVCTVHHRAIHRGGAPRLAPRARRPRVSTRRRHAVRRPRLSPTSRRVQEGLRRPVLARLQDERSPPRPRRVQTRG
jgi:predicted restriction endonuclease